MPNGSVLKCSRSGGLRNIYIRGITRCPQCKGLQRFIASKEGLGSGWSATTTRCMQCDERVNITVFGTGDIEGAIAEFYLTSRLDPSHVYPSKLRGTSVICESRVCAIRSYETVKSKTESDEIWVWLSSWMAREEVYGWAGSRSFEWKEVDV